MMTAREMILNSAARGNGVMLSVAQAHEAASWILDRMAIEEMLLCRYMVTFQNYVWTDARAAIDLMNAEVITLRQELSDSTKSIGELRKHCVAWEEKVSELTSELEAYEL